MGILVVSPVLRLVLVLESSGEFRKKVRYVKEKGFSLVVRTEDYNINVNRRNLEACLP